MNEATVAGHLGADPEVRFTSSGQKVTTLRLAARTRKGETIWWRVTIWGEQFDKIIPYFKKGSPIIVIGEISKPEIFMDKEGKPQISVNITAHHISFSPFGKPEGGQEGFAGHMTSAASVRAEPAHMGAGVDSHSFGQAFGQGSEESLYSDNEIPF